jgi:predicted short-subunit dehydrogenase-like oxidoreductase (DUF2520 family)
VRICYAPAVRKPTASDRPAISIVGPGNLGSALALALSQAGYEVRVLAVRTGSKRTRHARALARRVGARLVVAGKESLAADVVWITVPDDAIANAARQVARSDDWKGKLVFHSSGALTSDELAALRAKGARVASVHPMMTFVRDEVPQMSGVAFALEGDAAAVSAARSIVEALGAKPFVIKKQNKLLYHVFGSFASPMVIALMATMEEVALAAGIRKREIKTIMAPLLRQTLANYLKRDAPSAFSGPLARGDVATLRRHLATLQKLPNVKEIYVALANAAARSLPVKNKSGVQAALRKRGKTD